MHAQLDRIEAHGSSYRIHNPGGLIGRPLATGRPYEQRLLEMIHAEHHVGLALDVGAHVGNHTLWFAAICGLDVVAFEPSHHEALRANIALNDLDGRVTVEPVALGATAGHAHLVGKDRLQTGAGDIEVRTIDSYDLEHVALIKIDVEDMEPAVLAGGETTIRRDRPVIYAEARDEPCHAAIAEVLEPWGYQMTVRVKVATPLERWACAPN